MGKNIKEEELQELKEHVTGEVENKKKSVKIIFDGKQTSIRIPADFVEIVGIDPVKDVFEFEVDIEKKKLFGRLIKDA